MHAPSAATHCFEVRFPRPYIAAQRKMASHGRCNKCPIHGWNWIKYWLEICCPCLYLVAYWRKTVLGQKSLRPVLLTFKRWKLDGQNPLHQYCLRFNNVSMVLFHSNQTYVYILLPYNCHVRRTHACNGHPRERLEEWRIIFQPNLGN
jgi:hypothetical protein